MRGSDAIIELLIAHGVEHVFGVPGDTSMNFHDAFAKRTDRITHILCRDERNAGYMADAYGRVKGKPGVVETPSGGGALYVVPAVSEAHLSSIPFICISSDITMSSEETNALTDTNQEFLFKSITKWNTKIRLSSKIPHLIRKAFRMATGGCPGAVHISVPENILGDEIEFSQEKLTCSKYFCTHIPIRNKPSAADVEKVVSYLSQAKRPAILAGGGIHLSNAYEELEYIATNFNIPVATSINGKGSMMEFSPHSLGVVGANGGTEETLQVLQEADFLLVLGSKLNNVTTMGQAAINKSATIVQVDISETVLDSNIRTDLPIMCDIKFFLQDLSSLLAESKEKLRENYHPWNEWVFKKMEQKWNRISKEVKEDTKLVLPCKIFHVLEMLTDDNTIFVADAGTPTPYLASYLRLKKAGRYSIMPRAHGSLGYALPAAIGAKVAKPDAKVISLFGDASLGMALGDLETAKRLNLPIVFINFQNNSYGWIKTIQELYYDKRYFAVDFSPIDATKIAEGFGIKSIKIEKNSDLEKGLSWAIKQDFPVFVDIMIEPPTKVIPPVLKWERDSKIPAKDRKKLTY